MTPTTITDRFAKYLACQKNLLIRYLLYFAWARSKVKVCYYFHILWHCAVFAQLPENIALLAKTCFRRYLAYPASKQSTNH